jgi:hypothetical protein
VVAEATGAKDPNLIVAAILYDAIEDQGIAREEIAKRFGDDVASRGAASPTYSGAAMSTSASEGLHCSSSGSSTKLPMKQKRQSPVSPQQKEISI